MGFIIGLCIVIVLMVLACFIVDNTDDNKYRYQEDIL